MSDEQKFRLSLEFDAASANPAKTAVNALQDALQGVVDAGGAGEKAAERYIRALQGIGSTSRSSAGGVSGLAKAFQALTSGVSSGEFTAFQRGIVGMIPATASLQSAVALAAQKETELGRAAAIADKELAAQDKTVAQAQRNLAALGRTLASATKAYADLNLTQASRAVGKDLGLQYDKPISPEAAKSYAKLQSMITLTQQRVKEEAAAEKAAGKQIVSSLSEREKALEVATKQQALYNQYLYDERKAAATSQVGNFYPLIVAAGIFGSITKAVQDFGTAVIRTGVEYDSAFAQVARTTTGISGDVNAKIATIRQSLKDVATEIPVSFQNLAGVATLGNQLGIASDNIVSFTKTVSQFSAVTGVTTEETAKSFGSLAEVLNISAGQYDNLASAITYVGRNSVATEAEILTMSQKIGATAEQAGFTTQQVIGLSGALASLREAPERSQGALEIYFKTLNTAAAEGGQKLKNFANVIGSTTSEAKKLIQTNPYQFLREFLGGLSQLNSTGKTSALTALGLSGTRVSEVLRRLSANLNVVDKTQSDANQSFKAGSDLQTQYAVIAATLGAKFTELQNAVANLLDTLAKSGALSGLGDLLGILTNVIKGVDDFAQKNKQVTSAILGLAAGVGVIAALRTAFFLAAIAASALEGASLRAGGSAIVGNLRNIITVLFGVRAGGYAAAGGMAVAADGALTLRGAVLALGRATIILAILAAITELVFNFAGSMQFLGGVFNFIIQAIAPVDQAILTLGASFLQTIANVDAAIAGFLANIPLLAGAANQLYEVAAAAANASSALATTAALIPAASAKVQQDVTSWANSLSPQTNDYNKQVKDAAKQSDALAKSLQGIGTASIPASSGLGNVGGGADNAAAKVRTLKDYANDLSDTFSRAFDIRTGPSSARDDITTQFQSMQKSAKDAAQAVTDAKNKISDLQAALHKLQADNVQQKYFLSVAQAFGDTNRAGAIQANIDQNNSDISKNQSDTKGAKSDLSTAQDAATKSLKGNTAGAIANRKALNDLEQKYQDYIVKLAASGASQKQVEAATKKAKEEFIKQATQLGYNKAAVDKVARSFDDMTTIIKNIPRNVTVSANVNPALQALNEYAAAAKSTAASVSKSLGGLGGKSFSLPKLNNPTRDSEIRRAALEHEISALAAYIDEVKNGYLKFELSKTLTLDRQKLASGNYWNGGFTGHGGKFEPAGIVHKGEYVVPKEMVDQRSGLPRADALGRLMKGVAGRVGYSGGGYVDPGMSVVELGPRSMAVLRAAVHSEVTALIEPKTLANSTNSVNSNKRRRGGDR